MKKSLLLLAMVFLPMFASAQITDDVIRFNFNEGLAKVKQNLHLFENLNFIDGIPRIWANYCLAH